MKNRTKPHTWTQEEILFLKNNVKGLSYQAVTELFNKKFSMSVSFYQIKGILKRNKLTNDCDKKFQKGHVPYNKDLRGIRLSPESEFKKGHQPHNYKEIGSERINGEGYIDIKIADPNVWKAKHRIIWEEANGPLPEGHCLIFSDKNKLNIDLDNMILVSRKELAVMNKQGLISKYKELTVIGKSIAAVKIRMMERVTKNQPIARIEK
jgi:hypothetical protein